MSQVITGNCLEVLRGLPDNFFHCCITSPPYPKVRKYPVEPTVWDDPFGMVHCTEHVWGASLGYCQTPGCGAWFGILGDEPCIEQYIRNLVLVFEEVKRVLRPDGVAWINLGDTYSSVAAKRNSKKEQDGNRERTEEKEYATGAFAGYRGWDRCSGWETGGRPRNLNLAPERLAIALQDAGWNIPAMCHWHKPNAQPSPVADRPGPDSEFIIMATKSTKWFYCRDALRDMNSSEGYEAYIRTTWSIQTQPSKTEHSSTFPDDLVRTALLLSTADKCCSACGAPYKPKLLIKPDSITPAQLKKMGANKAGGYNGTEQKDYGAMGAQEPSKTKARILKSLIMKFVESWEKDCGCNTLMSILESEPCKVLDPFAGTGTTGYVCGREGRDFTGIELNRKYAEIADLQLSFGEAGMERKEVNLILGEI